MQNREIESTTERVDRGPIAGNAWVTMITNDDYVDGAIALGYSLLAVKSRYGLVVLTTSTVTDQARRRLEGVPNCTLRHVEAIELSGEKEVSAAFPHSAAAWTQVSVWQLEEFARLVWLDADMLVRRNMDQLFDLGMGSKAMATVSQCMCTAAGPGSLPYVNAENCPFINRATGKHIFNAGLLVIKPSAESYRALLSLIDASDLSKLHLAEQELLNDFFKDEWHVLDYVYSANPETSQAHPGPGNLRDLKNIHYIGQKPWICDLTQLPARNRLMNQLYMRWWDTYREARGSTGSSL